MALEDVLPFRSMWSERKEQKEKSEVEKRFDRMRWAWIGMAIVGSIGYWMTWGPTIVFHVQSDGDGGEEEEKEEEDANANEDEEGAELGGEEESE